MSFARALLYFLREAATNLLRSWRASLLAIATIALSLFVGGFFLLTTGNLQSRVETWRDEFKVVIYLEPGMDGGALPPELLAEVAAPEWVAGVTVVDPDAALRRFRRGFPSLADALGEENPFQTSLEAVLAEESVDPLELELWARRLAERPEVSLVDDDRAWLDQLRGVLGVVRWMGLALGLGLLVAAGFTTAAVVRLSALLHLDEIEVLRLVGATEFFIRGPFYVEGLLQGLFGGVLALSSLFVGEVALRARAGDSIWGALLFSEFLAAGDVALLLTVGLLAGLLGAVLSLRRERLEAPEGLEGAPP
ncbi:MAG TPA: FtsX-like permease family protein [Thermoanaerobaculia bacterium]|nr:FtsX-like permease family protein [Thermoanaerobaculia bacterium]